MALWAEPIFEFSTCTVPSFNDHIYGWHWLTLNLTEISAFESESYLFLLLIYSFSESFYSIYALLDENKLYRRLMLDLYVRHMAWASVINSKVEVDFSLLWELDYATALISIKRKKDFVLYRYHVSKYQRNVLHPTTNKCYSIFIGRDFRFQTKFLIA